MWRVAQPIAAYVHTKLVPFPKAQQGRLLLGVYGPTLLNYKTVTGQATFAKPGFAGLAQANTSAQMGSATLCPAQHQYKKHSFLVLPWLSGIHKALSTSCPVSFSSKLDQSTTSTSTTER